MDISIMDVIGPVRIGPSSSHTAGAARLGGAARALCGKTFNRAEFGLHGSFAKTYRGHGTDLALLAGIIGMSPEDGRIPDAFQIAAEQGLAWKFFEKQMEGVHENAVEIRLFDGEEQVLCMVGSSIGGGRIMINDLNGCRIDLSAELPAIVISHMDRKGMIHQITSVLLDEDMNVGTLKLTRNTKGEHALSIIEVDESVDDKILERLRRIPDVLSVQAVQI